MDIVFIVSVMSQIIYTSQRHLDVVKHNLRYLKESPRKRLLVQKTNKKRIENHVDANWTKFVKDKRSTTGYNTNASGNLVT